MKGLPRSFSKRCPQDCRSLPAFIRARTTWSLKGKAVSLFPCVMWSAWPRQFCGVHQHRDEMRAMGRAARAKIESQFTLEHYNQRMIELFKSLAT